MAAGTPLEDADRWPWLDQVGAALGDAARRSGVAIVACSVLKRAYRTRVAAAAGLPVHLIFLDGSTQVLEARMHTRTGHFMPASLLESQLATLERPGAGEDVLTVSFEDAPEHTAAIAKAWIDARRDENQPASSSDPNSPN